MLRGIRGAITVEHDTAQAIAEATRELLTELLARTIWSGSP